MKATHENVRDVLQSCGPMASIEVASFFPDDTQQTVAAIISTMRTAAVKQVYIESWTREKYATRTYLRAVYALGDKPDARKPPSLTMAERSRRWKAKQRPPVCPNSVWQLGDFL